MAKPFSWILTPILSTSSSSSIIPPSPTASTWASHTTLGPAANHPNSSSDALLAAASFFLRFFDLAFQLFQRKFLRASLRGIHENPHRYSPALAISFLLRSGASRGACGLRQQEQRAGGRRYAHGGSSQVRRNRANIRRARPALQRAILPRVPSESHFRWLQPGL